MRCYSILCHGCIEQAVRRWEGIADPYEFRDLLLASGRDMKEGGRNGSRQFPQPREADSSDVPPLHPESSGAGKLRPKSTTHDELPRMTQAKFKCSENNVAGGNIFVLKSTSSWKVACFMSVFSSIVLCFISPELFYQDFHHC